METLPKPTKVAHGLGQHAYMTILTHSGKLIEFPITSYYMKTRDGRIKNSFVPWKLSLPTYVAHGYEQYMHTWYVLTIPIKVPEPRRSRLPQFLQEHPGFMS
jgi:hypothetical protein